MGRKKLFNILAFFIVSLFLINYTALKFYWYYSIWWFDMPMHFLGGLCAGIGMVWLFALWPLPPKLSLRFFLRAVMGVLLVGVLWEVFEFLFNNVVAQNPFDALDTASDILFDLLGGVFAIPYFFGKIMPMPANEVESSQ